MVYLLFEGEHESGISFDLFFGRGIPFFMCKVLSFNLMLFTFSYNLVFTSDYNLEVLYH